MNLSDFGDSIHKLWTHCRLTRAECLDILCLLEEEAFVRALTEEAVRLRELYYGKKVYTRGLIEFTNYCKNGCRYCGIQAGNGHIARYRLTEEEILCCCETGWKLGFQTFVLQGGEDPGCSDAWIGKIVARIRDRWPDCAITLSVGERDKETYRLWKKAGADRYLLRHETANAAHYRYLHPDSLSLSNRIRCLYDLKELGYQIGAGFMVGSPGQTVECLADDLVLLQDLKPEMVGIGPFIPHHDTVYAGEPAGSLELTLKLLSLLRVLLPKALLPATTALGSIDPMGREKGLMAGANVVMPNLSPAEYREQYSLYDNKICLQEEAVRCHRCLQTRVASAGYELVSDRGDHIDYKETHSDTSAPRPYRAKSASQ